MFPFLAALLSLVLLRLLMRVIPPIAGMYNVPSVTIAWAFGGVISLIHRMLYKPRTVHRSHNGAAQEESEEDGDTERTGESRDPAAMTLAGGLIIGEGVSQLALSFKEQIFQ
jgi:uncharacterized oligopeptide transporter (OPT) family protein